MRNSRNETEPARDVLVLIAKVICEYSSAQSRQGHRYMGKLKLKLRYLVPPDVQVRPI